MGRRQSTLVKRVKYYIPSTAWIPGYSFSLYVAFVACLHDPYCLTVAKHRFTGDFLAGITVASMLIPQSVSYATSLAKLSPVTGLVCSAFDISTSRIF